MAEPPFGGVPCPTCAAFLPYQVAQLTGKLYARCTKVHANGFRCTTFLSPPGRSRPVAPPRHFTAVFDNPVPPVPPPPPPPSPPFVDTGEEDEELHPGEEHEHGALCSTLGCKKRRARNCQRKMCRGNCRREGGCPLPGHYVSRPPRRHVPPVPVQRPATQIPPRPPPSRAPPSRHVSTTPPPRPPTSMGSQTQSGQPLDPRPNPRHFSQLRPEVAAGLAHHNTENTRRLEEQYERRARSAASNTVEVVSCTEADDCPQVFAYQHAIGDHFVIDAAVLVDAQILQTDSRSAEDQVSYKIRNHITGLYSIVRGTAHVVDLSNTNRTIYIMPRSLPKPPPAFAEHARTIQQILTSNAVPNVRTNLVADRASVLRRMNTAHASPSRRRSRSSLTPPTSPARKKRRHRSTPPRHRSTPPRNQSTPPRPNASSSKRQVIVISSDSSSDSLPSPTSLRAPHRTSQHTRSPSQYMELGPRYTASPSPSPPPLPAVLPSIKEEYTEPILGVEGIRTDVKLKWPRDFLNKHIHGFFKAYPHGGQATKTAFQHFFNVAFVERTYTDNLTRWKSASDDARAWLEDNPDTMFSQFYSLQRLRSSKAKAVARQQSVRPAKPPSSSSSQSSRCSSSSSRSSSRQPSPSLQSSSRSSLRLGSRRSAKSATLYEESDDDVDGAEYEDSF